jgi:ABC-2 type transport system ATP-binding protein
LEIRDLLLRLGKEKTVILSTHILQEVPAVCSRVVIIARGKKVADAPLAELLRREGTIRLVCAGLPLAAAEQAALAVPGVAVRSKATVDHRVRLDLAAPPGAEVCESLASAIVGKGGRITEIARQSETLEECFHRHTVILPEGILPESGRGEASANSGVASADGNVGIGAAANVGDGVEGRNS